MERARPLQAGIRTLGTQAPLRGLLPSRVLLCFIRTREGAFQSLPLEAGQSRGYQQGKHFWVLVLGGCEPVPPGGGGGLYLVLTGSSQAVDQGGVCSH